MKIGGQRKDKGWRARVEDASEGERRMEGDWRGLCPRWGWEVWSAL